jgi:two-component system chemotaxis sensor kinase CheA
MNDEMNEIVGDFLAESTEMLEALDQYFIDLETDPNNAELLNEIFRVMHSMKGSAGFLGFNHLVEVAHQGESLLNMLRNGKMSVTKPIIDIIFEAIDIIKLIQTDIRDSGSDINVDTQAIVMKLSLTIDSVVDLGGPSSVPSVDSSEPTAEDFPQDEPPEEESFQACEQVSTPVQEVPPPDSVSVPAFPSTTPSPASLSEMLNKMSEVASRTMEVVTKSQQGKTHGSREEEQSVRVETRRLDHVMNLVGELVLSRNRIMKLGMGLEEKFENDHLVRELGTTVAQLNLVASDLQIAVMKTRMVPIRKVFAKFPRLVRDLSNKLGKQIRLELSGEETEVDKSVADELGDPLVHLVRNSLDHAIETAAERQVVGKSLEGTVHLSASQEGNSIVIRIVDDGRGLQVDKLKAKALAKGLVSENELIGMDDREAMNLIFQPGFSTADTISDVSGRGVGMDVVRTNISRMNGSIELDSEPGMGCQVTIKLPLTVAIIQALLVQVECSTFAIPLASVVEAVKVTDSDIKTVNGKSVLNLRDRILPLVRLADEFGIPCGDNPEESYVVVVAVGERHLGIVVDRLRTQEEVVIKSLGEFLADISGVAGATITGDGKVVLILDMAEMVQRSGSGVRIMVG